MPFGARRKNTGPPPPKGMAAFTLKVGGRDRPRFGMAPKMKAPDDERFIAFMALHAAVGLASWFAWGVGRLGRDNYIRSLDDIHEALLTADDLAEVTLVKPAARQDAEGAQHGRLDGILLVHSDNSANCIWKPDAGFQAPKVSRMATAYVFEEMAKNLDFADFILVWAGLGLLRRSLEEEDVASQFEGYSAYLEANACRDAPEVAARFIEDIARHSTGD